MLHSGDSGNFITAEGTTPKVDIGDSAGDRFDCGVSPVPNPTPRALVLPIERRLEMERALKAELNRLKLSLYLSLLRLYVAKRLIQFRYARVKAVRDCRRLLSKLVGYRGHVPLP